MEEDERLLVFARSPEKGRVKTRLARATGEEMAVELYRCFVGDTLALCRKAGYRPSIFFQPPEAREVMAGWLGSDFAYEPQEGDSLGDKMYHAFRRAFRTCRRAVLIGTDVPDLPPAVLREAFHDLWKHDAVIGPALDGGYYLIGLCRNSLSPVLFDGLPWGGAAVLDMTKRLLEERNLTFTLLPRWRDIDRYDDLRSLFERLKGLPPGALLTIDYLRARGW